MIPQLRNEAGLIHFQDAEEMTDKGLFLSSNRKALNFEGAKFITYCRVHQFADRGLGSAAALTDLGMNTPRAEAVICM